MVRKHFLVSITLLVLILLSACASKEAVISSSPQPTLSLPSSTPPPSSVTAPGPEPMCILKGEEIVSLCGTAFSHNAMLTADGKLLVWGETPFDLDQCVLRQDNGGSLDVYELPLTGVTKAWLGRTSILALDRDGVLWGIGGNLHGQMWDAPEYDGWNTPVKITDHVVTATISGWSFSAVVKDDGGVWLAGSGNTTIEDIVPPTRIAEINGATEIYAAPFLYVLDKDGISWRLGRVNELLEDPTALMSEQYSGGKWVRENLWLTNAGTLICTSANGEEQTLLTNVVDVDLSYDVYTTAVTKDGDLYTWNAEKTTEYEGLSVHTPTKVMEGVKLAGAWEHGVVVTKTDGTTWVIYKDTLEAAMADNRLIGLSPYPSNR